MNEIKMEKYKERLIGVSEGESERKDEEETTHQIYPIRSRTTSTTEQQQQKTAMTDENILKFHGIRNNNHRSSPPPSFVDRTFVLHI